MNTDIENAVSDQFPDWSVIDIDETNTLVTVKSNKNNEDVRVLIYSNDTKSIVGFVK